MIDMARALTLLSLGSLLGCAISASNSSFDYDVLQYVDPLIGTANGGMYIFSIHIHAMRKTGKLTITPF